MSTLNSGEKSADESVGLHIPENAVVKTQKDAIGDYERC